METLESIKGVSFKSARDAFDLKVLELELALTTSKLDESRICASSRELVPAGNRLMSHLDPNNYGTGEAVLYSAVNQLCLKAHKIAESAPNGFESMSLFEVPDDRHFRLPNNYRELLVTLLQYQIDSADPQGVPLEFPERKLPLDENNRGMNSRIQATKAYKAWASRQSGW